VNERRLVEVASAATDFDADVLIARLAEAGIGAVLARDDAPTLGQGWNPTHFNVLVHERDVDRATAVLGVDPADTTHARPVSGATAVLRSVAHYYTLLMAIVLVVIIVIAVVELAQ
jgi:hypothetical protein